MKEIVNRLHENRQIELAKSILESNGYKVTKGSKRLKEALQWTTGYSGEYGKSIRATAGNLEFLINPVRIYDEDDAEYFGVSPGTMCYTLDCNDEDGQHWIEGLSGEVYTTQDEAKTAVEQYISLNNLSKSSQVSEATTGNTMSSDLKRSIQVVADEIERRPNVSCVVGADGASITYRREGSTESFNQRVSVVRVPEYHVYNHLGDEVIVTKDLKELELSMTMLAKEDLL